MAQEFFNYVKRDYENAPDWASVTKTIGNDLEKISEERQNKRQAIEEASLAAVDALNQQEMGANQTLNQMILDGSNASKAHLLEMNKLMKQNKIKPEQYMNAMQAQLDDWSTLSAATKGWNQDYADYKKRMEEGISAGMERSMAEWNEEFGNVANKAIVINPTNGRLYMTTKNPDGSVNTDPEKMVTVNALNNRLKDRVEKYDVVGAVAGQVQQLGQIVKVINADGKMTIDDIRQNPEFITAEDKMVTALMGTPRNVSSILSDYVGGYGFTYDPKLKGKVGEDGKEMILLKPDGNGLYQPEFTESQTAAARDHIRMQLEMQLPHKETPAAPVQRSSGRALTDGERNARDKAREQANIFQTAVDLASGDEAARTDALNRVKQYTNISNIVKQGNEWKIEMKDGTVETVESTGDPELDAKSLFVYTVGEDFKQNYGSTSPQTAYDAWKKGGNVAGDLASDFGEMEMIEPKTAYDIKTASGSTIGDDIIDIFSGKEPDGVKIAMLRRAINTMVLPKGMQVPSEVIDNLEKLRTLRGVTPADIVDKFNIEIEKLINEYNSNLGAGGQQQQQQQSGEPKFDAFGNRIN